MKKNNIELSRRSFLSKGAIAAGSSIIAIQAMSPQSSKAEVSPLPTNDPVYTESTQTLTNKTIPSWQNTLGTDHVNVKEFTITSGNITSALNAAISFITTAGFGGKILIPHGVYTTTGNHELTSGITIEGVGVSTDPYDGTELVLTGTNSYVFRITSPTRNVTLKDFTINMGSSTTAIGLLMTDSGGTDLNIHNTTLENIYFNGGGYGIKVNSVESGGVSTHFECIMNRFERVRFFGCVTSFFCNTGNSGFLFDSCDFTVPPFEFTESTIYGTALDCKWIGYAEFSNCLFIGVVLDWSNVAAGTGSTVLKTFGAFGSLYFHNCQDENIRYNYRNATNDYPDATLVYKNCLIQGSYRFTAHGAVTFENCQINTTAGVLRVTDTSTAAVRIFLKGLNRFFVHTGSVYPIQQFVNAWSQTVYEAQEINAPLIHPTAVSGYYPATYTVNGTRGAVQVISGTDYVVVYDNLVGTNSLIFAQFREDPGSTAIKYVKAYSGYFEIHLTANAASTLSIGFTVVG